MQLKSQSLFGKILSPTVVIFVFAVTPIGVASAQTVTPRPCDLYASATPCVAAFSTTRALYSAYTGPLYQVTRQSDKTYTDIGLPQTVTPRSPPRTHSAPTLPVPSPSSTTSHPTITT